MATSAPHSSFVRTIAAISGLYDVGVGIFLLAAADRMAATFGVPPPQPAIFGNLNGLFLVAVGTTFVGLRVWKMLGRLAGELDLGS